MQWMYPKNCRSVLYFGYKYLSFWLSFRTGAWRKKFFLL